MKKAKYPNLNDYDISACSDSGYGGSRSIVNNMKNYESGSENEKCLNDALDPQTSIIHIMILQGKCVPNILSITLEHFHYLKMMSGWKWEI